MQGAAPKYLEGDLKPYMVIQESEKCNINSLSTQFKKKKGKKMEITYNTDKYKFSETENNQDNQ